MILFASPPQKARGGLFPEQFYSFIYGFFGGMRLLDQVC